MIIPLIGQILAPIFIGLLAYILKDKQQLRYAVIPLQLILLFGAIQNFAALAEQPDIIVLLSAYQLPIGMSLRLDYLANTMLFLNNIIFLACTFYDLNKAHNRSLFIFLFVSLQGLINGVFLTNDLFNIYIMVEVSTIVVSVLIMFKKDAGAMYNGMFYLFVNIVAMSFFIFGVGYIYKYFGVFDFDSIAKLLPLIKQPSSLIIPYAFMITGVSLKSAVMPVFSWLPKAHGTPSAPAAVSAVLSGIFVKTGIFLIIRLTRLFGGLLDISHFLLFAGIITAILGFVLALGQADIKLILSYHTISQIGLILIGISLNSAYGLAGGIYHIVTHGIFKSLLFILANELIILYGTRKITEMKGLWQRSKFLSVTMLIAVFSITGAPLFSGGFSKAMIKYGATGDLMTALVMIISLGTVMSFVKFFNMLRPVKHEQAPPQSFKITFTEKMGLSLLAVVSVLLGLQGNALAALFTGTDFVYHYSALPEKLLEYVIYLALGYLLYHFVISKNQTIKKFRQFDVSFNSAILTIVLYFISLIGYMQLTIKA